MLGRTVCSEANVSDPGRVRVSGEVKAPQADEAPSPAALKPASSPQARESEVCDLDATALIELAGVSPEVVERAQRVSARMENPGPLGEIVVKMGGLTAEALERARQLRLANMSVVEILQARGQLTDRAIQVYEKRKSERTRAARPRGVG